MSDTFEPTAAARAFPCFAFLWSTAILLHQIHQFGFARPDILDAVLNLAVVWALLQPGSVRRFVVVCAAQVAVWWHQMPFIYDHWIFLAFSNITILICAGRIAIATRRPLQAGELFAAVSPVLRINLLLLYGFAGLAKLNPAYFDLQTSCGTTFYTRLVSILPILPTAIWAQHVAIWSSVAIELGLPVLLLIRRTRVVALFVGGLFHLILGINGNYDFSAALLPFYYLFLDVRLRWGGMGRWRFPWAEIARSVSRRAASPLAYPVLAAITLAAMGGHLVSGMPAGKFHGLVWQCGRFLWLGLTLALGAVLVVASGGKGAARRSIFRPPYWIGLIGPLLMAINGLCPYLGLKTEQSLTMFSNLQTEGDKWNHYFMPRRMRVFDFQNDLDELVSSSDPDLQTSATKGESWVSFELRRHLSAHPDSAVSYAYNGQRYSVSRAVDDPHLSRPVDPILGKLFWFRPVTQHSACTH